MTVTPEAPDGQTLADLRGPRCDFLHPQAFKELVLGYLRRGTVVSGGLHADVEGPCVKGKRPA